MGGSDDKDDDPGTMPILVGKDRHVKISWSAMLETKAVCEYNTALLVGWIRFSGHKKLTLQSDNEPAIVALKESARARLPDIELLFTESPVKDHQANGDVEVEVREVKRTVRAIKGATEQKLQRRIPPTHPLIAWMPHYASSCRTRFLVGDDGLTAEQRRSGRAWRKPAMPYGERCMFMLLTATKTKKEDLQAKLHYGYYVGSKSNGTAYMMTTKGVLPGGRIQRLIYSEAWSGEEFERLTGFPWNLKPKEQIALPSPVVISTPMLPARPAPAVQPFKPKAFKIYKDDVDRYGMTQGCHGCMALKRGEGQRGHTPECRARFAEELAKTEDGRKRVEKADERKRTFEEKEKGEDAEMFAEAVKQVESSVATSAAAVAAGPVTGVPMAADVTMTDEEKARTRSLPEPVPMEVGGSSGSGTKRVADVPTETLGDNQADETIARSVIDKHRQETSALSLAGLHLMPYKVESKLDHLCCLRKAVKYGFDRHGVEVTDEQLDKRAWNLYSLGHNGVDVAEVFSPARFTASATNWGLQPGFACDLHTLKEDGEPWDLTRPADEAELETKQRLLDPYFLTGCPPCESFSMLKGLIAVVSSAESIAAKEVHGRKCLGVAFRAYQRQIDRQRHMLHEHPAGASSWTEADVTEFRNNNPDVIYVKGPMCKWDMMIPEPHASRAKERQNISKDEPCFVLKETGWLTTSPCVAHKLSGWCSNRTNERPWHRHLNLIGGIAHWCKEYPQSLVDAVLEGIREQLIQDGELNEIASLVAGPSPDADLIPGVVQDEYGMLYWDDINGSWLETKGAEAARAEELSWVEKRHIWDIVPVAVMVALGLQAVGLRWIDTNKGDRTRPNYRSRLVCTEVKKKGQELLPTYVKHSSTPPTECLRMMCALMMSLYLSVISGKRLKMRLWDVSRAHFYGKAERDVFVRLPEELRRQYPDHVGHLRHTMYGTQDASHIWEKDYNETLTGGNFRRGIANGAIYYNEATDTRLMVYGDDFLGLGDDEGLDKLEALLRSKYDIKVVGTLGPDEHDAKELVVLNRTLSFVLVDGIEAIQYEADSRHADCIVRDLGLQNANAVATPQLRKTIGEVTVNLTLPNLPPDQHTLFRSVLMRSSYLSQDRGDLCNPVKDLAARMSKPTAMDMTDLKRMGRYIKGKPRVVWTYKKQRMPKILIVKGDSDHAGCLYTRRSTTGLAVRLGGHTLKNSSHFQSTIGLSSGESEYYDIVKASQQGLGTQALLADWNVQVDLQVDSDSNAALGIAGRHGLGSQRHINTRYLWVQEKVARKELTLNKVAGDKNQADLMTKVMKTWNAIDTQMRRLGQTFLDTAKSARKLLTQ